MAVSSNRRTLQSGNTFFLITWRAHHRIDLHSFSCASSFEVTPGQTKSARGQKSFASYFPSPPFCLLHNVHSSAGWNLTFVPIFRLPSFVWTKWNMRWTSMTRTPSSTASGTLRAAWATSQTRGTRRTICRRACRCCLSWAPTLCSPWFYASGQCVRQRSFKSFSYLCWQSFSVQTICTMCGTIRACVCAARARGVPRTLRSSTKSCSTSRLPPISPPL